MAGVGQLILEKWCPFCIDEARRIGIHATVILAEPEDCQSRLHAGRETMRSSSTKGEVDLGSMLSERERERREQREREDEERRTRWVLKRDRMCYNCASGFPKGTPTWKFLVHIQHCGRYKKA